MEPLNSSEGCRRHRLGAQRVICCCICVLVIVLGCVSSTPEERAQKLYDKGRYEAVVRSYPESKIAKEARYRIAERLLQEGRYQEILQTYADCPSARDARKAVAKRLLEAGEYVHVATYYSDTPSGAVARDSLAERLYRDGSFQTLLLRYSNTPAADRVFKNHPEVVKAIEREELARKQREEEERKEELVRKQREGEERKRAEARQEGERREAETQRKLDEYDRGAECRFRPSLCLRIGMRQSEVTPLIGQPGNIQRHVGGSPRKQEVSETWIYIGISPYDFSQKMVMLDFDDGILTGWTE